MKGCGAPHRHSHQHRSQKSGPSAGPLCEEGTVVSYLCDRGELGGGTQHLGSAVCQALGVSGETGEGLPWVAPLEWGGHQGHENSHELNSHCGGCLVGAGDEDGRTGWQVCAWSGSGLWVAPLYQGLNNTKEQLW